ncbi:hypothetical protein [Delftia acidovorans]
MTDIVNIPDLLPISQYPALGSANFNQEAYNYATSVPPAVSRMREIVVAGRTCAIAAQEFAQAAQSHAGNALTYSNNAATSAGAAATQAGNALTSANNAATSAGAAATHASTATAALTAMQVMYLGSKAVTSHPTADNMGNPLQAGALYTNTGTNAALNKRGWWWDGGAWQLAWGDITGVYMPTTGGTFTGHINVPQGASGNQAPRASEVTSKTASVFDHTVTMSAAPLNQWCAYSSGTGVGSDWPPGHPTVNVWDVITFGFGDGINARYTQIASQSLNIAYQGWTWIRNKHDGAWSQWARVITDTTFIEKVYATSTGVGPGGAKVYTLDPSKGSIHQLTVEYNTYFTGGLRGLGDQITMRLKFSGGAWPIGFNTNFRFPAGTTFPTYSAGQTLTLTFVNTEGSFIDVFIAGVHNP